MDSSNGTTVNQDAAHETSGAGEREGADGQTNAEREGVARGGAAGSRRLAGDGARGGSGRDCARRTCINTCISCELVIKGTILNPFSSTHFSETPRTAHVSTDDGSCFVAAVLRRLDQGLQWYAQRSNEWLNGLHLTQFSESLHRSNPLLNPLPLANCLKPLTRAQTRMWKLSRPFTPTIANGCGTVVARRWGRRPLCL